MAMEASEAVLVVLADIGNLRRNSLAPRPAVAAIIVVARFFTVYVRSCSLPLLWSQTAWQSAVHPRSDHSGRIGEPSLPSLSYSNCRPADADREGGRRDL